MKEKKKYLAGTKKVLKNSQKIKKPYWVTIAKKKFIILPNVFSPKYFFDTEFFAKNINVDKDEKFLEIGPGSGVISVFAALNGAKVTAIDINPQAVKNTIKNAKIHNVEKRVKVYQGNLFSPLAIDEKFDIIFWNTPFGYINNQNISILEKSVFDPKYKSTKIFISGSRDYLKDNGRLLIGFSPTLGHLGKLKDLLKENGFVVKMIAKTKSVETHPVSFDLFEARIKN